MEKMPVFIKVDEYQQISDMLAALRDKIEKAKEHLSRIEEIKKSEDEEIENWKNGINELEAKLDSIHEMLGSTDK